MSNKADSKAAAARAAENKNLTTDADNRLRALTKSVLGGQKGKR